MNRRAGAIVASFVVALLIDAAGSNSVGGDISSAKTEPLKVDVLCAELEAQASARALPADFFIRLIWKESRFNPRAVSPKGAEGIAQFMPATAAQRGLEDPFDPITAIAESASYLADLAAEFGNLGLAAAAYNAGPEAVRNWLVGQSDRLSWETVEYVQFITGRPVKDWDSVDAVLPKLLENGQSVQEWCRSLPVRSYGHHPNDQPQQPTRPRASWVVQLVAHFDRDVALRIFARLKKQYASVLAGQEPIVVRHRNPGFGPKARYAVRLGFNSLAGAEKLCNRLRAQGGACGVIKN